MGRLASLIRNLHGCYFVSILHSLSSGQTLKSVSFYSTVWGATIFTSITGLAWAVVQWAPFSLVCWNYRPYSKLSADSYVKLAEAILSEDAQEEDGSIMLSDTRSSQRSDALTADHEEQPFLVGGDEDDYEEVRSFRSSASMDSQEGDEGRERQNSLMSNSQARQSHLEVHTTDDPSNQMTARRRGGGGLAAKAGIILVSSCWLSSPVAV